MVSERTMFRRFATLFAVVAPVAAIAINANQAYAQGCIVGRQCEPGSIGAGSALMRGQVELSLGYRGFRATKHYNGTVEQTQRQTLGNYVINQQNIWDVVGSYGLDRQSQVIVDIPLIDSGWSIPLPIGSATTPHGPRYQQKSSGIGDISIVYKRWILDTAKSHGGNFAFGIGIKPPTGKDNAKSDFPDLTGGNIANRTVDQSIQPGDGGWGIPTSVDAYKMVGPVSLFMTDSYLISPRDTNGVPSIRTNLGVAPSPLAPSQNVNSVPDQYLLRFGVGGAIPNVKGLSASLAWRKEGVPVKDLIGGSHGWRRPGFSTSIEPGISYTAKNTSFSISVPITLTRDRVPTNSDGTPTAGDSTFANYQVLLNVSRRFNTK